MANNAYMAQYRKEKQKQINFAQSIDYIDKLEEYCKARGIKKNTFIKLCIDKEMALHPLEQYTEGIEDTSQLEEGEKEEQTGEREEQTEETKVIKTEQNDEGEKDQKEDIQAAIKDIKSEIIKAIIEGLNKIK